MLVEKEETMNRIKLLRERDNITQEKLGSMLNVQKAAISKYENNIVPLTDETIKKLCDVFNVSSDYLLGKSDIENVEEPYDSELDKVLFSKAKELTNDEKKAVLSVINAIKKDVDDGKI
jgi:transcriptional regulator with XRE-family HTH domain